MTSLGYSGGDAGLEMLRDGAIKVRFTNFSEMRSSADGFVAQMILFKYSCPSLVRRLFSSTSIGIPV